MGQLLLSVAIHALAGGVLVVCFALLAETIKPKDFAGLFSAAPSIALASLVVSDIAVGSKDAALAASGMVAGGLGMVIFCAWAVVTVRRHRAIRGSLLAAPVWFFSSAIVMVVDPKIGVNSVAEFTALAKTKPGQILFGSVGPGSLPDLCGELYAQRAGVKLVQVPYPGSPQVIIDLMAGRVAMNFAIASSVLGQIASRQVKPLAIAADKRSDLLPDVPTMAEAGIPDFDTPLWFGLLAPKGTPQPAIDKLADAARKGMHTPESLNALHSQGFVADDMGPDRFGAFIKSEIARWSQVAQAAGLVKT